MVVVLAGCQNGSDPTSPTASGADKQIRIEFPWMGQYDVDTAWTASPPLTQIPFFRKSDYPGVSSLTVSYHLGVYGAGRIDVQLFDVTNDRVIPGTDASMTASSDTVTRESQWFTTGNIWSQIPDQEITLAVRLKMKYSNGPINTGGANIDRAILLLRRE
jgi:hypothetical protein